MNRKKSDIINAQRLFHLQPTGMIDPLTESAIRNFQLKNDIPVTGDLDGITRNLMFSNTGEDDISTDLSETFDDFIQDYFLPEGEYINTRTNKEYLFLHHTAGWNNPYSTIDMWARDNRGRVGTHYVIGGINPRNLDESYDGVTLRAIEDDYYAWHLGAVDKYMHKHSIGIEVCNFGYLIKKGNGFYTYVNTKVHESQVIKLGYKFRGHKYWHKYTDKQIESLRNLIIYLTNKFGISTYSGLQERLKVMSPKDAFEYYDDARHGEVKGILSHTSVRRSKYDMFPQDELVDMLLSI